MEILARLRRGAGEGATKFVKHKNRCRDRCLITIVGDGVAPQAHMRSSADPSHLARAFPFAQTLELSFGWGVPLNGLAHLSALSALVHLAVTGHSIGDEALLRISSLSRLRNLDVKSSFKPEFTVLGLSSLSKLCLLQHLSVDVGNGDALAYIAEVASLRHLDIADSSVSGESLLHLSCLTALTFLGLANTCLTDAAAEHLQYLSGSLIDLDLRGTFITDSGMPHVARCHRLCSLNLEHCPFITSDCLAALSHLPALRRLELSYAALLRLDSAADRLSHFPALNSLGVRGFHVDSVGMSRLGELQQLETLDLSCSDSRDEHLEQLRAPALRELRLASCRQLSGAAPLHLTQLSALTLLDLKGTDVGDEGVRRLVELLPNLRSVYLGGLCCRISEAVVAAARQCIPEVHFAGNW